MLLIWYSPDCWLLKQRYYTVTLWSTLIAYIYYMQVLLHITFIFFFFSLASPSTCSTLGMAQIRAALSSFLRPLGRGESGRTNSSDTSDSRSSPIVRVDSWLFARVACKSAANRVNKQYTKSNKYVECSKAVDIFKGRGRKGRCREYEACFVCICG